MTPTWQIDDGRVQLYLADCRDVLPFVKADIIITDPPYGIHAPTNHRSRGAGLLCPSNDYAPVYGDDEPFDPSHLLGLPLITWGANYYSKRLPDGGTWLVWDKRDGFGGNDYADCEIGWYSKDGSARLFNHLWNGAIKASEKDGRRCHPTQKPVALMRWCIELAGLQDDSIIVDPYCGGGATGIAAIQTGHRFIGIEIVPDYIEATKQRCIKAIEQHALYEPVPKYVQGQMFQAPVE